MILTDEAWVIWYNLTALVKNPYGVAGILGNLYAESALNPMNLQNSYERKLYMTDEQYTRAVDDGTYKDFATDNAGYGLAQWTFCSRKKNLEGFAKTIHESVGNLFLQINFIMLELSNYSVVLKKLREATSIVEATSAVYYQYEKPASSKSGSEKAVTKRIEFAQQFYDGLHDVTCGCEWHFEYPVLSPGSSGDAVTELQKHLIMLGYNLGEHGTDGKYGTATKKAVATFQEKCGVYSDGKAGAVTQYLAWYLARDKGLTVTIYDLTLAEALEISSKYPDAEIIVK